MPGLSDLIPPVAPANLPTLDPAPTFTDPANFDTRADTHVAQVVAQVPLLNAENAKTFVNAQSANMAAQVAVPAAQEALVAVGQAQQAAAAAIGSSVGMATSTSNVTIGTGDKVFLLVEANKDFSIGQTIVAALASDYSKSMLGKVKAWDKPNKLLTMASETPSGAGTYADWRISVSAGSVAMPRFAYADRGQLRATSGAQGAGATVEGLGLFIYAPGSDEPDDDESCFATADGRWLLEAVSFEVVDAWLAPVLDQLMTAQGALYATKLSPILNISGSSEASFTVTIPGAEIGDRVVGTPGITPGYAYALRYISFHVWVSAPDTVTVSLWTPSTAPFNAGSPIGGTWSFAVFKETT
jgi:hypothetical protein